MTQSQKHTPGIYEAAMDDGDLCIGIRTTTGGFKALALMLDGGAEYMEKGKLFPMEANAAHIIACVNSRDALVEALWTAEAFLEGGTARDKVRAALKLAGAL